MAIVKICYCTVRLFCSVLYSCATEEGPFGAETFCLLVKKCATCLTLNQTTLMKMASGVTS